jgi:hypothetical protein
MSPCFSGCMMASFCPCSKCLSMTSNTVPSSNSCWKSLCHFFHFGSSGLMSSCRSSLLVRFGLRSSASPSRSLFPFKMASIRFASDIDSHLGDFLVFSAASSKVVIVGSGITGGFSFPGELKPRNGHGNVDFLGSGASTGSGAETFLQFLPDFAESAAAIFAGGGRGKEPVHRPEVGRVRTEKRETARSILGD